MVHFVSKAISIHFIDDNNNYNYVGLIYNSMICSSIWINNACNAGMISVIVLGCTSHYYNVPTCITRTINSNTTANHTITYTKLSVDGLLT